MDRRGTAVAMVVLAAVVLAGVQLADPFRPAPDPPRIDPIDPPHELLSNALDQTEVRDYTLTTEAIQPEEGRRLLSRRYVENSERELLVRHFRDDIGGGRHRLYLNEHVRWIELDGHYESDVSRRSPVTRVYTRWSRVTRVYTNRDVVVPGAVEVVRRNASMVILRVDDTEAAFRLFLGYDENADSLIRSRQLRANLTMYVDLETGAPRRAVYVQSGRGPDEEDGERWRIVWIHEYSRWDETNVERPPWAGYSLAEFVADLTDPSL